MQEPEIFEQPVRNKDPEADAVHYYGGVGGVHVNGGAVSQNGYPYSNSNVPGGGGPTTDDSSSLEDFHDFVYPEDRKLGTWSTTFLIINRVVGSGIYSTPSSIIRYTNSVGATLLFWVLGGIMTFCGMFVYLEYGTALPRSGGEKVYLERVYQKPRYLATCIFAVQFVLFAVSTGNSISFSSYFLRAVTGNATEGSWLNRGIAIAAITVVCLIHAFTPRLGIWLGNGLGAFKLILLSLVVCTGFAALAGRTVGATPDNFSSFDGAGNVTLGADSKITDSETPGIDESAGTASRYALALLQVLYSYSGWENANYVGPSIPCCILVVVAGSKC